MIVYFLLKTEFFFKNVQFHKFSEPLLHNWLYQGFGTHICVFASCLSASFSIQVDVLWQDKTW